MRTNKNINKMLGKFQRVARAMTKEYGVKVVEGNTCATNGSTITFPANADHLDEATQETLEGMLDHEIGHHTEEQRHKDAGRKGALELLKTECKNRKEGMLLNVYEDIRMERVRAEKYIGVAQNLAACAKHSADVLRKRYNGAPLETANFWHILGCGIIYKAQNGDLTWLPAAYRPYLDTLADEISDIRKAEWAEDALAIARRTIEKMGEVAEQLKQEQEQRAEQAKQEQEQGDNDSDSEQGEAGESDEQGENGQEQGDSEQGEADGDETEAGTDSSGENGDEGDEDGEESSSAGDDGQEGADDSKAGENSNGATDENSETDGESDDSAAKSDNSQEGDIGDGDMNGMSDEELDAAAKLADGIEEDAEMDDITDATREELKSEADYNKETTDEYLTSRFVKDTWVKANEYKDAFDAARKDVSSQTRVMKSKLVRLMKARAQVSVRSAQLDGDLDHNDLWSVETGNKRVFTQTADGQTVDTAVSVLIDMSGSMGRGAHSRSYYARCATIGLAETFEALKVPFEVVGFHNIAATPRRDETGSGFNMRQDSQEYVIFKEFNEKYRRVRNRLGSINGSGTNSDSPAVLEMAKRLVVRPEHRKILFVLSDGQPNAEGVSDEIQGAHLRKVVKQATDAGIEVIAVAIMTSYPHSFYNEQTGAVCSEVHNLDELAVTVYKLMKDRLTNNRKGGKGKRSR